ncbi:MAG: hypothetical protein HYY03_01620 [Chloroflexi bacterium]|nr:hypothetical protein [Chloroflexota bacterium]
MSALTEFRKHLTEALGPKGISVCVWSSGTRYSRNLLQLSPRSTVLYVKEFNPDGPAFWGLTKNQIDRLEKARARWFSVLLLRSVAAGYVLTDAEVRDRIEDSSFRLAGDGDYKVHEDPDLNPAQGFQPRFQSIDELLDRIL